MKPLPPISLHASVTHELLVAATDGDFVQCICGHDPAVTKDEDNGGIYYEVECLDNRCHDCDVRVSARTQEDAERAWADLIRSIERKIEDGLERQREAFGSVVAR